MLKRTFNKKADIGAFAIQEQNGTYRPASEEEILDAALSVINARFSRGTSLTSPEKISEFLKLHLSPIDHEIFAVL